MRQVIDTSEDRERRRMANPLYKKLEAKYGDDEHMLNEALGRAGFWSKSHGKFDDSFFKAYDEAMGPEYAELGRSSAPRKSSKSRKKSSARPRRSAGMSRKEKSAANRAAWARGERW